MRVLPVSVCLRFPAGLAGAFALTFLTSESHAAFHGLGFLETGTGLKYSEAMAISADGSTIIGGSSIDPSSEPDDDVFWSFRWTEATGMQALPKSSEADVPLSRAYAVSADGSVIVGQEYNMATGTADAYRWTAGGVVEVLPHLNPSLKADTPWGVSGDGTRVVGGSPDAAFGWTSVDGTVALPTAGCGCFSAAYGISADGSTVVGFGSDGDVNVAYRWTVGGAEAIPVPAGSEVSEAYATSANGATIVGMFDNSALGGQHAFAWTELGVVTLSTLDDDLTLGSSALAVSADGEWAVGDSNDVAVVWNTRTGEVWDLKELLIAQGNTGLDDWTLQQANGISADGTKIVGTGLNADGDTEGWVATITAVPEPSSFLLGSLAFAGALIRRRKR